MNKTKNKISPQKYKEIFEGLSLENMELVKSYSHLQRENFNEEKMDMNIVEKITYTFLDKVPKNKILITQSYCLTAGNKTKYFIKMECEYHLILDSKKDFTDDFFNIYKQISLPMNTWPFFREFVYNMSSRMYVPPIVLPFKKVIKFKG